LSGGGPDIVFTAGPSYVASMAQAGQLLSLDDYAQKLGWNDRLLPLFLDLGKYNGKLYALAKTYETLGLFYNKTMFDKNGWKAPTTIPELEALAEEAKKAGLVPFGAGNADWRPTNEWYVSIVLNSIAGPDNVYKALTGAIPWTDPSIVAAIVETLHGTVTVGDTPGGGATFRVSFPLSQSRDAADHLLIETQPLQRLGAADLGRIDPSPADRRGGAPTGTDDMGSDAADRS
ncbi:MAG: extracellular solute-binding protein, partial [Microbacterium sp.]|nr:extracellular solute-binding protein [Microbacterium sp.]